MSDKNLRSYVTGFALSLVFTLIPYYLVANHRVAGTKLLFTILSFAFVQLIVQLAFFLHLGRGPAPKWNLYFFAGTVGVIMIVVGGSIIIINNLHRNLSPADQTRRLVDSEGIYQVGGELTGACQGRHTNYQVIIKGTKTEPLLSVAAKCDTLTFIDNSAANLEIVFGTSKNPKVYAGLNSIAVIKGHSKTITLSQLGTYQFHDNTNPKIVGSFAVADTY